MVFNLSRSASGGYYYANYGLSPALGYLELSALAGCRCAGRLSKQRSLCRQGAAPSSKRSYVGRAAEVGGYVACSINAWRNLRAAACGARCIYLLYMSRKRRSGIVAGSSEALNGKCRAREKASSESTLHLPLKHFERNYGITSQIKKIFRPHALGSRRQSDR